LTATHPLQFFPRMNRAAMAKVTPRPVNHGTGPGDERSVRRKAPPQWPRCDGASEKEDAADNQREYVHQARSDRLVASRRTSPPCCQAPNDEKDNPDAVNHAAGIEVHSFPPAMSYTTRRIRHMLTCTDRVVNVKFRSLLRSISQLCRAISLKIARRRTARIRAMRPTVERAGRQQSPAYFTLASSSAGIQR